MDRVGVSAIVDVALLGAGFALMFVFLPFGLAGDGLVRYQNLTELLEQGVLSGSRYSMVGPLFAAPLYYLGKVVATPEWWCARFNIIVFGSGLVATGMLMRRYVDAALVRRFLLLMLFGSMFPAHVKAFYGEVFSTICIGVGLLAIRFGRPRAGWAAVVLGVVNTPGTLVALAIVTVLFWVESRRLQHLIPLVAAATLIMLESWIRRGDPFVTGYEADRGFQTLLPYSGRPGFSYPFFLGLISILFSFGKGLVFFAPGLVLGGTKQMRTASDRLARANILWLGVVVGLILVYSKWWSWYGGWFWGPRFFLFASLPAALLLATRLHLHGESSLLQNVATLVVLGWSLWVGINGAVFGNQSLADVCVDSDYALESFCWYLPEYSVLFRPFVDAMPLSAAHIGTIAYVAALFVYLSSSLLRHVAAQLGGATRDLKRLLL